MAGLRGLIRLRRFETDRANRRLRTVASIDDLRRLARRRLPGGVFDYIDGGADDEITLGANTEAFRRARFRPRVLRGTETVDTSTTLLGRPTALPLVLAPTGFTRIAHPAGELAVVRAAGRAGVPFTLSTMGTRSIEECAAVAGSDARLWFQVYVWRDREHIASLVRRAAEHGFEALVLTVDTAVLGRRERDVRRGFTLPPSIGPGTLFDGLRHPGWTLRLLRGEPIRFSSAVGSDAADGSSAVSLAEFSAAQFDPGLSWRDVEWLQSIWDGPIVLKGVQTAADARLAVDAGVAAIALSNHGGRQLDTAPTPLELLPEVVAEVGGRIEIIVDGGVRRGSDIVKACALGADAVMAGRPHLYALGAAGEPGVDHMLGLLRDGTERTLALVGAAAVADLTPEMVELRP
jgi:L-lactate dehydrogenase (cytochrome)